MEELRELLRSGDDDIPLDVCTLQIGAIEYPGARVEEFIELLDSHGSEFGDLISDTTDIEEFVGALNGYMFGELGFEGDTTDYYSPANCCLHQVLMRRVGIPITLSVVYMEIARRVGREIDGVGLPGHFLVRCSDGDSYVYLDPFHGGRSLSSEQCFELARAATDRAISNDPVLLMPVSRRQISVRILNNLRSIYFSRQDMKKAVQVLDLLLEAAPDAAEEYKQRGVCLARLQQWQQARADLETYLRLAPGAHDGIQVRAELDRITRLISLSR